MTRLVTYSLTVSLDGYVTDANGSLDWGAPAPEVFELATDEVRGVDVHLMGRRLYETMLFWEADRLPTGVSPAEREFAAVWQAMPRVVFSTSLTKVKGNARLSRRSLAHEIEVLRATPGDGVIAIGGASLATQAAELGLIDEYRMRVMPVLLGGGQRFFAHDAQQVPLELLESRVLADQVQYLRYRMQR